MADSSVPMPQQRSVPEHSRQRQSRYLTSPTDTSYADGSIGGLMAKLALIYGMRLLPEDDLGEVRDATVVLKNGRSARVTMHLIEGSKEEIETTFRQSIEAFFEMYPE